MEIPTLDKFPRKVLAAIDIQRAFVPSRLIVAAERLRLFRRLRGTGRTAGYLGRALKIHSFYRDAFLDSLVSLGLLRKTGDTYWNTRFAEKYFIDERSIYWTRQYSKECVQAYDALTILERALKSGSSYASIRGLRRRSYTERMKRNRRQAQDFTQMLFHFHQGDAEALAKYLDLSKHRAMLDVGGGSGVMSIALAKKNPHLQACILDLRSVCRIAAGNIRRAGLSRRVHTRPGDFRHGLPVGYDVILLCDIGPVTKRILRSAYQNLPAGGLIVVVDRYLSEDGTRPLDRIVSRFVGSRFGQSKRSDMVVSLQSCGFRAVKARKRYRDVWFITGSKPGR